MRSLENIMRVTDTDGNVWITDDDWYETQPGYKVEKHPDLVLDASDIATFLDADAESGNYHDVVGAHEWIAEVVTEEAGAQVALEVMKRLAEKGGFHNFR